MGFMGMLTACYCMFRPVSQSDQMVSCEYAKVAIKETKEQIKEMKQKPILKNSVATVLLCSEKV